MIQMVLELDLADYPSDSRFGGYDFYQFERWNRDNVQSLPSGSPVRLRVGRNSPCTIREFFREDLLWQIVSPDPRTMKQWQEHLEGVPIAEY